MLYYGIDENKKKFANAIKIKVKKIANNENSNKLAKKFKWDKTLIEKIILKA